MIFKAISSTTPGDGARYFGLSDFWIVSGFCGLLRIAKESVVADGCLSPPDAFPQVSPG